jgi:hypothetical protein
MNSMELLERTRARAKEMHEQGITSAEVYARADEQDRTGFTVSAPFTRLLAQALKELENPPHTTPCEMCGEMFQACNDPDCVRVKAFWNRKQGEER